MEKLQTTLMAAKDGKAIELGVQWDKKNPEHVLLYEMEYPGQEGTSGFFVNTFDLADALGLARTCCARHLIGKQTRRRIEEEKGTS